MVVIDEYAEGLLNSSSAGIEYEEIIDNIETLIDDDIKFPVVEDGRIKLLLKIFFEFVKFIINYITINIDATKKTESKSH